MKLIALAAALAMGAPAIAQTNTGTTGADTTDQTTTDTTGQMSDDMSGQTTTTTTADSSTMAGGADPAGGYEPSSPPLSGTPEPGQEVIFRPSVSPDQAFPPPAPLNEYPICKAGQTDDCRQRGG